MRKADRHRLIEKLITQQRISTQGELVSALRSHGAEVTQATVSRDMREMGMQKGFGDGGARFILPQPIAAGDPETILGRMLIASMATVKQAQNLIVVRSQPGTAPSVGRAIDELEDDEVVGTVAGDDTVLMVLPDDTAAKKMTARLSRLMQI